MLNPTGYYRPQSIEEAARLIAQPHIETVILSGGALRLSVVDDPDYEAVVDVQAIPALNAIERVDDVLSIGAAAPLETVMHDERVPALLRDAIRRFSNWNQRNAVSIAEAIEFPHRMAEVMAALLALNATLVFAMPEESLIPLADLDMYKAQPRLPRKGLMVRVIVPTGGLWTSWGRAVVARTPRDAAIVSAAVTIVGDETGLVNEARIALTGVCERAACLFDTGAGALVGQVLNAVAIDRAVSALDGAFSPVSDYQGSATYRLAMAKTLLRRALVQCLDRLNK
jgi:xanthine dehydrogenase small subunit